MLQEQRQAERVFDRDKYSELEAQQRAALQERTADAHAAMLNFADAVDEIVELRAQYEATARLLAQAGGPAVRRVPPFSIQAATGDSIDRSVRNRFVEDTYLQGLPALGTGSSVGVSWLTNPW
jgi:hypothetical protein